VAAPKLKVWHVCEIYPPAEITRRDLDDVVRLHGMYQPDEMWDAYCEIDVAGMATTVCEPFGRIPVEARAAGAPTIAPAVGGIRGSIRDRVDGLLYAFGEPAALTERMRRVLTERGLFDSLSVALQPVIDTRTRGAAIEAVYHSILSRTPA
jgi:glycosyltransferase involved in cell wall biosynthesis